MFENYSRIFFWKIGKIAVAENYVASNEKVQKFKNKFWAEGKTHTKKSPWIDRISTDLQFIEMQKRKDIKVENYDFSGSQANGSLLKSIKFLTSD